MKDETEMIRNACRNYEKELNDTDYRNYMRVRKQACMRTRLSSKNYLIKERTHRRTHFEEREFIFKLLLITPVMMIVVFLLLLFFMYILL